jgi:ATP-binding cassette, subfamily B (MDR/TAP), member 1
MLCGLIFANTAGGGQPVQGVFFAKSAVALSRPPSQSPKIRSDVDFWSLMYLILGLVQLLSMGTQGVFFAYCSEALIFRARSHVFRTLLRQDIAFFDKRLTGTLTSFLATEITHLAGLSSTALSTLVISATTLISAIVVSLAVGWKLALVILSTMPVVLGCGFFRFWALSRFESVMQKSYTRSASYVSEKLHLIRTTASLSMEHHGQCEYSGMLASQDRKSLVSNLKISVLYALSQSVIFLCISLGFWYGGTLIGNSEYILFQFFVYFAKIIFSFQSAGAFFSFTGDMGKRILPLQGRE